MAKKLTFYILMGMMLGIVVGAGLHFAYTGSVLTAPAEIAADAKTALEGLGKYFGLVTDIFLRMIKMIIAPLVFATLVSGIVQQQYIIAREMQPDEHLLHRAFRMQQRSPGKDADQEVREKGLHHEQQQRIPPAWRQACEAPAHR